MELAAGNKQIETPALLIASNMPSLLCVQAYCTLLVCPAGTIFVYGQTGAGKTHTMDAVTDLVLQQLYTAADDSSNEVAITVSAVELYNEVLRCLLSGRENLQLRWASGAGNVNGVVLEGAEERVSCLKQQGSRQAALQYAWHSVCSCAPQKDVW